MTLEDILLLFVVLALGVSWWLIRMVRHELEDWDNETEQWGPR